ncbi:ribosomal protein S18 acetylase RimI-like enzyme [Paucibacter oligotrophus]|uniref:Ribosomal protein S18 acetylase RimI-like enzyme n=1 Tax=Roseateles oligotrophus TaxID=1769250 RepID=A0A840LD62_9BURK|nr:GNAT family N-acetyltransferase [Roseateles oligotrophus]MBB4844855.1 ribosomal protein S18 acetylase RimI-like enzyme [Roseateles oligotrophus]
MNSAYRSIHQTPDIATYQALRQQAGLSPKSHEAAAMGLPNSLFSVQILQGETPVGMGRVIGDGGCFFQVVDIAVLPAHQGQGLGKRIMAEIMSYLREAVPPSGYVSLIADGQAKELYTQYGFKETAPRSVGMALPVQKSANPATEA